MAGEAWTDDEKAVLKDLRNRGFDVESIFAAGVFPGRSDNSIRIQCYRLGVGVRDEARINPEAYKLLTGESWPDASQS